MIDSRAKDGQYLHAILLDLRNAYGNICKEVLIKVVELFKLPRDLAYMIERIDNQAVSMMKTNRGLTKTFWIEKGILQEDPTVPLLFTLVMECVGHIFRSDGVKGVQKLGIDMKDAYFADDTLVIAQSHSGGQNDYKRIKRILANFQLSLNEAKTVYLCPKPSWINKSQKDERKPIVVKHENERKKRWDKQNKC
jgi:hypothetical protein